MKRRLRTKRDPGQSIVLIALILAVLIGIVALSVDVGNAYAQQRAAQRAADSASLEGMRVVIANGTQRQVLTSVSNTLTAHNVPFDAQKINSTDPTPQGLRGVKVYFVLGDANGSIVSVGNNDSITPNNVRYLQVKLSGTERTTFATLVGRADLPVVAGSYARRALCGAYPIGINVTAFTVNDPTERRYSDNTYSNLQQRRLYLRDDPSSNGKKEPGNNPETDTTSGRFVWLRWLTNNGGMNAEDAMADALKGDGNADNFQEAPWPSSNNWNQGKPNPYPQLPGSLGETDVMYGNQVMRLGGAYSLPSTRKAIYNLNGQGNVKDGLQVAEQLKWHVDHRTVMNLPLYTQRSTGIREGGRYQAQGFESFIITGYGYDDQPDEDQPDKTKQFLTYGKGWYIDVARVGKAKECPYLINEKNLNDHTVKLAGRVEINPKYKLGASSLRDPIDLVVVLDASGSMNWNWNGEGTLTSGSTALAALFNPAPNVGDPIQCSSAIALAAYNGCQPADAWSNPSQRRLYIAKQSIKGFLEQFPWAPNDRAAVVTYNRGYSLCSGGVPAGTNVLSELTKVYPASGLTTNIAGSSDSLTNLLETQAATSNPGAQDANDLYKTLGASPGALGLTRASNELDKATSTGKRERVIIFFTDGLLNVNLKGERSLEETVEANAGAGKPITQAMDVAENIKSDATKPAAMYVVALSKTFDDSGLSEMASGGGAPYYQEAQSPAVLPNLLGNIGNQVINGDCDPREEGYKTPDIGNAAQENGAPSTRIGTVAVTDANGNAVATADIKAGGVWEVPGLQPNTNYNLRFTIFYRGLDNEVRTYNYVFYEGNDTHNSFATLETMPVTISDTGLSYTQSLPDPVKITMKPNTDICKATTQP